MVAALEKPVVSQRFTPEMLAWIADQSAVSAPFREAVMSAVQERRRQMVIEEINNNEKIRNEADQNIAKIKAKNPDLFPAPVALPKAVPVVDNKPRKPRKQAAPEPLPEACKYRIVAYFQRTNNKPLTCRELSIAIDRKQNYVATILSLGRDDLFIKHGDGFWSANPSAF